MKRTLERIRQDFDRDLAKAVASADFEQLKVAYLGKKGPGDRAVQGIKKRRSFAKRRKRGS